MNKNTRNPPISGLAKPQKKYADNYKTKKTVNANLYANFNANINKSVLQQKILHSLEENSPTSLDYKTLEAQIQEELRLAIDPLDKNGIKIEQYDNQEYVLYSQLQQLEKQYTEQLKNIKQSISQIEDECRKEKSKVFNAEQRLRVKHREVQDIKTQYQVSIKAAAEFQQDNSVEVQLLQSQLRQLKQQHNEELSGMNQEAQALQEQNSQLSLQLEGFEQMIKEEGGSLGKEQFQLTVKTLEQQEQKLKNELVNLEKESNKIREEVQKIVSIKPISPAIHQKYLDLYEKVIVYQRIQQAEQIVKVKERQREQASTLRNRKVQLQNKIVEVKQKQIDLQQRNRLIQDLNQQIKAKSTMLLQIYQDSP